MSNPPNLPPLTATADRRGVAPPAQHATSKISVIGSTLRIEGDQIQIIASDKLLLEGRVRGDLFGTEIVIGESAHVEGVVVAKRIEVHGRVAGAQPRVAHIAIVLEVVEQLVALQDNQLKVPWPAARLAEAALNETRRSRDAFRDQRPALPAQVLNIVDIKPEANEDATAENMAYVPPVR